MPNRGGASKPRRARMKRRTLDKAANEKTLAFLQKRGKATSITAIAREFRIKRSAANQRCIRLVEFGWARRSAAGMYEAVEPAAVAKAA